MLSVPSPTAQSPPTVAPPPSPDQASQAVTLDRKEKLTLCLLIRQLAHRLAVPRPHGGQLDRGGEESGADSGVVTVGEGALPVESFAGLMPALLRVARSEGSVLYFA